MTQISFKAMVVATAIGMGSLLAGGASAAPLAAAPAVAEAGHASQILNVDHRRGHFRPGFGRACTASHAATKARRMGLRSPRVVVRRNVMRVTGWMRGHRTAIVFARSPGCPVIR